MHWVTVTMTTTIESKNHRKADVPMRKEAYTTYLYWGFAVIFVALLVAGFTLF